MQTNQTSITSDHLYRDLIRCTVIGFLLIFVIYLFLGGSLSSRWQFAVFMSATPAVLAWALTWWNKLRPYAWAVYAVLFLLLGVAQARLRTL